MWWRATKTLVYLPFLKTPNWRKSFFHFITVFSSGQWTQPVTYTASDVATPKKQGSEWEEKLREDCGHHCTLQSFLFTAKLWVCESERERKRTYCLSLGRVKRALCILFHWSHCFCSILKCSGRPEQMQEYVWVLRSADLTLKTELDLVKKIVMTAVDTDRVRVKIDTHLDQTCLCWMLTYFIEKQMCLCRNNSATNHAFSAIWISCVVWQNLPVSLFLLFPSFCATWALISTGQGWTVCVYFSRTLVL